MTNLTRRTVLQGLVWLWLATPPVAAAINVPFADTPGLRSDRVAESYGRLPLSFEANQGQTDGQVKFLSRGNGYTLFLTSTGAVLAWRRPADKPSAEQPTSGALVRMKLVGADAASRVTGLDELPGEVNYFIGNDPSKWRTNVPTYARVRYDDVYPGVDLIYYGNQRQLEYDFVVHPGADPGAIKLAFEGARSIERDASGNLIVRTAGGDLRMHKPVVYQEIGGVKRPIPGGYVLENEHEVGFHVAAYDRSKPLVIDPVLAYSTYLGGGLSDTAFRVAVDSAGNAYVTGTTGSADFPTTADAFQTAHGGGVIDAFLTKLNPAGSALVYSTYLGGSGVDVGRGIAVDSAGSAYVAASTSSLNFPTTAGAFDRTFNSGGDAYVAKFSFNQPPVADAGPDPTVSAGADCQALVTLNGTGSSDPNGDTLTFTWTGPFGTVTGATPTVTLPLGTHTITLTVDDGNGGTASDTVVVTVTDSTKPVINVLTVNPGSLWPPNHRMVPVAVTAAATDNCSGSVVCQIVSVSSNEPIDGLGDGDTAPDWEITGALSVSLRAERSGTGSGRIYTVTVQCTDAAGNSATKTMTVTVPHDQAKK